MRIEDLDEICLGIWQIFANSDEIWLNLAGKCKNIFWVGGMGPDRSENPNSTDCALV